MGADDDILLSLRKNGLQAQNNVPTDDTANALHAALAQGDDDQGAQAQQMRRAIDASENQNREPQGAFSQAMHELPGDVMRAFSPSSIADTFSIGYNGLKNGAFSQAADELPGNVMQALGVSQQQEIPQQPDNRFALIRQYLGGG